MGEDEDQTRDARRAYAPKWIPGRRREAICFRLCFSTERTAVVPGAAEFILKADVQVGSYVASRSGWKGPPYGYCNVLSSIDVGESCCIVSSSCIAAHHCTPQVISGTRQWLG